MKNNIFLIVSKKPVKIAESYAVVLPKQWASRYEKFQIIWRNEGDDEVIIRGVRDE